MNLFGRVGVVALVALLSGCAALESEGDEQDEPTESASQAIWGSPCYRTYTLRPGDTISVIAMRYSTTIQQIVRANPKLNPNLVFAGQRIYIPC